MNLLHLKYAVVIAETNSMTKAADLLLGGLRFHNDNHTFSSLSVYRGLKPPTEADRIEKDPRHGVAGA